MRTLFLILAIVAIYMILRHFSTRLRQNADASGTDRKIPTDMLKCDYCGVHVPAHEAVRTEKHNFCSSAHRRSFEQQSPKI